MLDPAELVERDLDLLRGLPVQPSQHLEVAAGDRDRRAQLMGDVVEEALLLAEQIGALGRLALEPAERVLAAARMPDHREEHRGHERHLEQLAPELGPGEGVAEDQAARAGDHEPEHDARGRGSPDPEAVDEGQADPDEMERDRLPARPGCHRDEVRRSKREPRSLDRSTPH